MVKGNKTHILHIFFFSLFLNSHGPRLKQSSKGKVSKTEAI